MKPFFSCLLLENVGAEHKAFIAAHFTGKHVTPGHTLSAGKIVICYFVFLLRLLSRELRKDVDILLMSLFKLYLRRPAFIVHP